MEILYNLIIKDSSKRLKISDSTEIEIIYLNINILIVFASVEATEIYKFRKKNEITVVIYSLFVKRFSFAILMNILAICTALLIMVLLFLGGYNLGSWWESTDASRDGIESRSDSLDPRFLMFISAFIFIAISIIMLFFLMRSKPDYELEPNTDETQSNKSFSPSLIDCQSIKDEISFSQSDQSQEMELKSGNLEGDEKKLYQLIVDSEGEMLQRDIVTKMFFSKAKVSRILDKLENRGLIIRVRYGLMNKIKLVK